MSFYEQYTQFAYKFQEDLKSVLINQAAEEVKDIMQEQLDEEVYSYPASEMAMSSRRYEDGGLKDRANMVAHVEPGLTLVVENVAPFQNSQLNHTDNPALSDVVEKGLPGYDQPGARPFVSATETECVTSGRVLNSINSGLTARGYLIEKEM